MNDARGLITGHFVFHWGPPSDIRLRNVRGISEFAILEFAPNKSRNTWRYATNGMSSLLQSHNDPRAEIRTEVYASTESKADWVEDLLAGLAAYPHDYATYLSDGDTIDVGRPLNQGCLCYTGVLLAAPGRTDKPTLGLVGGTTDSVLVHQIIGLLPDEVHYADAHGGRLLYDLLTGREENLLDVVRASVLSGGGKNASLGS